MILKIVDLEDYWFWAYDVSKSFLRDFPEKSGYRDGCIYTFNNDVPAMYVYKTKTQLVVRKTN